MSRVSVRVTGFFLALALFSVSSVERAAAQVIHFDCRFADPETGNLRFRFVFNPSNRGAQIEWMDAGMLGFTGTHLGSVGTSDGIGFNVEFEDGLYSLNFGLDNDEAFFSAQPRPLDFRFADGHCARS